MPLADGALVRSQATVPDHDGVFVVGRTAATAVADRDGAIPMLTDGAVSSTRMVALRSLRPALSALIRNPILVLVVSLVGLAQLPQFALQSSRPLVAAIVSLGMTGLYILLGPFFQGGLLGMADEALSGRTGVKTLLSEGKANYVRLLLAYLGLFAVNLVFGFLVVLLVILGGFGIIVGDGEPGLVAIAAAAIVGLALVLAYLLVTFFVQFYAHAIVLSNTGLVEGFRRSIHLVRNNLLSVMGYSLIMVVGGLVLGGIGGGASLLLSPQSAALPLPDLSLPALAGAAAIYVLSIGMLGAFYGTYSVAFYRSIEHQPSE